MILVYSRAKYPCKKYIRYHTIPTICRESVSRQAKRWSREAKSKMTIDTFPQLSRSQHCARSERPQNYCPVQHLAMVWSVPQWLYRPMLRHNTHPTFTYSSLGLPPDSPTTISPQYAERTATTSTTTSIFTLVPNLILSRSQLSSCYSMLYKPRLFKWSWIK
jgi:hypothetical protein